MGGEGHGSKAESRQAARTLEAGLTLVEILVGMVIGLLLLGSIYYVYTVSARSYRMEEEVVRASETLRFAVEQLRRDIAAAGFLATPDSDADENVCPKPANRLMGIYFERIGDTYAPNTNRNIQPSSVTLFGAYPSPNVYFTESIVGNVVTLQPGGAFPATEAEFDQIFNANHMLRIVNSEQYEMYYRITSADYEARTVTLENAPPVSVPPDYCGIQGFGVGLEVNVVGYIRYTVRRDVRAGAPVDGEGTVTKLDLVREELAPDRSVVPGSRLIVAEYVVDLQFYDFVVDNDLTGRDPNAVIFANIEDVVNQAGSGLLSSASGSRPQDLRFVTVAVTVRTAHEDPGLPMMPRAGPHAPFDRYDADVTMVGAARTVSLASRVGLKAFQVRNVK